MLRLFFIVFAASVLSACVKFSGIDMEVSTGKELGTDQGASTNKMVYGVLGRVRMDANGKGY
jgi:hypothetical protein